MVCGTLQEQKGKNSKILKKNLRKNHVDKGYENCMHKKCPKEKVRIVPIKT